MFYKNKITKEIIEWDNMDFGDKRNSKCGICGCKEDGYWKADELMEDIICNDCSSIWVFHEEDEEDEDVLYN